MTTARVSLRARARVAPGSGLGLLRVLSPGRWGPSCGCTCPCHDGATCDHRGGRLLTLRLHNIPPGSNRWATAKSFTRAQQSGNISSLSSFAISFEFCLILQIFCVASQAVRRRIISEMHSSYELCGGSLSSETAPGSSESLLFPSSK